jgi:hypothetical protein
MRKPLICLAMAGVLLAGCRQQENASQLKAINQSLENANRIIQDDNNQLSEDLLEKKHDMRYSDEGAIWEPKGTRIRREADSIVLLIDKLKRSLLEETDSLRKDNSAWRQQFSSADGACYKLVCGLAAFRDSFPSIMRVDDFIDVPFRYESLKKDIIRLDTAAPLLPGYVTSLNEAQRKQYAKDWMEEHFSKSSPAMILVELNKLKNDLLVTTNKYMSLCLDKTKVLICGYPFAFSGVAVLNSSYVKQGQPLEITAGIGEFSAAMRPRISINGKEVKLNEEAIAVQRFTASGKPGKHTVDVKIEYIKPDGSPLSVSKKLPYIIAHEK